MKKKWRCLATSLATVCLLSVISGSASGAEQLDAETYVETLCSGDASTLVSDYAHTDELLNALEPAGGMVGLQLSLKTLGELQSVGEPIISEAMGYTSFSVPCVFAVQNVNLVLNVDGNGQIAGIVTAPYMENEKSDEDDSEMKKYSEAELNIPVTGYEEWELPGTLTLPEGEGPFPAVVLVHGSGPNDRDESIGANKPFKDLAEGLAEAGIAVYRYDKRTYIYGKELAADVQLTLKEETILDVVSAVKLLAAQEKIDSEKIYVAGYSLGGQAIPAIHETLTEDADAAGYIFMAAPARKLSELMREQYDFLYSLPPSLTEEQQMQKEAVYEELDRLNHLEAIQDEEVILGAYSVYWKDLETYDQLSEAAEITEPCLVLQGEEDYQVTMEDFELWKNAYAERDNWEFLSYKGLTHLFMNGSKENGAADYQKKQNVDAQVIADIAEFILAR